MKNDFTSYHYNYYLKNLDLTHVHECQLNIIEKNEISKKPDNDKQVLSSTHNLHRFYQSKTM